MIDLRQGDCKEVLKSLPDNSVDSIVTDPPYELGFMGKSWDSTGIANDATMWAECLRVLKPGGHLLAFSGTRTYHRMASAIEDAGFEVRDMIEWVYGSGFPKSLNIGKAVDKLQGNEREVVGNNPNRRDSRSSIVNVQSFESLISKGTSEYEGWGTQLKPAHEPICMARKPLSEKSIAENCLKWGTGGINIDESRVGLNGESQPTGSGNNDSWRVKEGRTDRQVRYASKTSPQGRFPANLIHDGSDEVVACFPETNPSKSGGKSGTTFASGVDRTDPRIGHDDNGGSAARFFKSIIYQAKASKAERNKGCEGLEEKQFGFSGGANGAINREENYEEAQGIGLNRVGNMKNNHPTVKPVALMEYLITMVTPENGTVLEPFMGSGTTGIAAVNLNRNFIGIEMDEHYFEIAEKRINNAKQNLFNTAI